MHPVQVLEEAVTTAARWGLVAPHQHVVIVERVHEHFAVKVRSIRDELLSVSIWCTWAFILYMYIITVITLLWQSWQPQAFVISVSQALQLHKANAPFLEA